MAKVRYDVTDVEAWADREPPKPGLYPAKIEEVTAKKSRAGNSMLEVKVVLTNKENEGFPLWHYVVTDDEASAPKLREFTDALGLKAKGTIDTDGIVGDAIQVRLRNESSEEYGTKPKVAAVIPAGEGEGEEDLNDGEEEDYSEWDLDDLKAEVEERDLEITGRASKAKLVAALEEDDAEGDDGDDPDEDEDDVDYDSWSLDDLKEEIEEREIKVTGRVSKSKLVAALEKYDEEEGDDGEEEDGEDYSEWSVPDLKAECESRGLKATGRKSALVGRLEKSDEDDDPFDE